MRYFPVFAVVLLAGFYWCQQKSDVNGPNQNEWQKATFIDIRCPEGFAGTLAKEDAVSGHYLNSWIYRNDTLKLHFLFDCTCYSAFQDSTVLKDANVQIFLKDTSSYHARCICSHVSELDLFLPDADQVGVKLAIQFYGDENYAACLDTLLEIGI